VQEGRNVVGQLCAVAATVSSTNCSSFTTPYATGFTYSGAGQMTGFSYANGTTASLTYSANRLQLTGLAYKKGTQTLFSLSYFYQVDPTNCTSGSAGNNGQIQCITDAIDSGRTANYKYDSVGRLASAITNGSTNYPKWGLAWTYDAFNNRTNQSLTAGAAPASALSFNSATNQPIGYTYDLNGNLTVEPLSPPNSYSYDDENDLLTYSGSNGTATFVYDNHGVRVEESRQTGTSTLYVYSSGRDIAEYDNGAVPTSPTREFIYGDTQLIAQITSSGTNYYHPDHLSVRMITDSTGNVIGQQGHYPFGEAWYSSNTTTNWVFTSYERDAGESGLDYAVARFYNNRTGSFCSVDPLDGWPGDPLSWNRYPYVENDPINFIDPGGQGFFAWIIKILIAIVTAFDTLIFPPSALVVPTFGGGTDIFNLIPGFNPHAAVTPPFLGSNISATLSEWVQSTAKAHSTNNPGAAPDAEQWVGWAKQSLVSLQTFTAENSTCKADLSALGLTDSLHTLASQAVLKDAFQAHFPMASWPSGVDMKSETDRKVILYNSDNRQKFQLTFADVEGTIAHELAHMQNPQPDAQGNTEVPLQKALGIDQHENDSTNISIKLANDCFKSAKTQKKSGKSK
jgi:RHS repeat-associated protein